MRSVRPIAKRVDLQTAYQSVYKLAYQLTCDKIIAGMGMSPNASYTAQRYAAALNALCPARQRHEGQRTSGAAPRGTSLKFSELSFGFDEELYILDAGIAVQRHSHVEMQDVTQRRTTVAET